MKTDKVYTEWINSFKGIAIIGIAIIHYGNFAGIFLKETLSFGEKIARNGNLGVEIFYIINSFLCMISLSRKGDISLKEYYKWVFYKLVRLVPLYWLAMFSYHMLHFEATFSLGNILSHYLFFNFVNPLWWNSYWGGSGYIGTLVLMWILLGLYYKKIKNITGAVGFVAIVYFICNICNTIMNHQIWRVGDHRIIVEVYITYFFRAIEAFSIGILLYYTLLEIKQKKSDREEVLVVSLGIVLLTLSYIVFHIDNIDGFVFMVLMYFLVLAMYMRECILIINPVFEFLGKYSWGIFLFHITVYQIIERTNLYKGEAMHWILSFVISIVLSKLLTDYYEKPVLKFINHRK